MAIRKGTFKVKNISTGEKDEVMLKTTVEQVEGLENSVDAKIKAFAGSDLTGMIIAYAGKDIPDGFLLCNGATISRTTYARLFAKIGTLYGAGDGSTTFTLPNLIERFVEGGDSSTAGNYKVNGLPNISGSFYSLLNGGANAGQGAITAVQHERAFEATYNESTNCWWLKLSFDASSSNSIYGRSDVVQPAAVSVQYLIKY